MSKITAEHIKKLLSKKHKKDVFVTECKLGSSWNKKIGTSGSIDFWTMKKSWANPMLTGYEIKVSRSDFLNDNKWTKYLPFCNKFYFICPYGIISKEEVGDFAGLMYVSSNCTTTYIKKKAPIREIDENSISDLYKYLLMSRTKIISSTFNGEYLTEAENRKINVKKFLTSKEEDRNYGRVASGKLRKLFDDKIINIQEENKQLKREIKQFKYLKERLESFGLNPNDNDIVWRLDQILNKNGIKILCRRLENLSKTAEKLSSEIMSQIGDE